MEILNVIIEYGPCENSGIIPIYRFTKQFKFFKLPLIDCFIILENEPMGKIFWNRPSYDPYTEEYTITCECDKRVERYKFSPMDMQELMNQTLDEFISKKWNVEKI